MSRCLWSPLAESRNPKKVNSALLREGLRKLGIPVSDRQIWQIEIFTQEIERWNRRMNLVKAAGDTLIIRHILDSLAGLPLIRGTAPNTLLDAGSGAGFPGILLALFLPDTRITLLDRSAKRASFLRNAVALLELKGCTVAEREIDREERYFDLVCCRAFRPLKHVFSSLAERLNPGGALVFYKGTRAAVDEELAELGDETGGFEAEIVPVTVPFLAEERQLLLFRDTSR